MESIHLKTLLPHQNQIAKYMIRHDRLLIYHSLGSGKTFSALASARYNFHLKTIVLCYSKLVSSNFRTEMEEFKNLFPYTFPDVEFVMYLSLNKKSREYIRTKLSRSFIIIDEAHTVRRGAKSVNYDKFLSILEELWEEGTIKLILSTGTPIVDSSQDLDDILALMNVKENPENYISRFKRDFRKIKYVGEKTPDIPWNTINLKLDENQSQEYLDEFKSSQGENFYVDLENFVLKTFIKQDKAIENISRAIKKKPNSKFFIYCGRICENGIGYINKKVRERLGILPLVITGKETRNLDMKEINRRKIILGSLASNEGISINGVTEVHIVTPHWNISQIEQVIGRGTRFQVGAPELEPLRVYEYVVYRDKPLAQPEYSLDLYKYHKSYTKMKDNAKILSRFERVLPDKETPDESYVLDIYEDLIRNKVVRLSSVTNTKGIESLCKYNKVPYTIDDNYIRVVTTEEEFKYFTKGNNQWGIEDVFFDQIYNMNFEEMISTLETAVIEENYIMLKYFKNNVFVIDNEVYHTFAYRQPLDRMYSLSYNLPQRKCLTKRLKILGSKEYSWVTCSSSEEATIWKHLKRKSKSRDVIEIFFSLTEKKFKLKINHVISNLDKRKLPRGKDIYSYTVQDLIVILSYVLENQFLVPTPDQLSSMKKKDIINLLIILFHRSGLIAYV